MSTDQEYDEQADMLHEDDPSDQSADPGPGPGPYPQTFPPPQPPQSHSMPPPMPPSQNPNHSQSQNQHQHHNQNSPFAPSSAPSASQPNEPASVFNTGNHLFDPYDPMLDADPFGLSASMHFPTQFTYETR